MRRKGDLPQKTCLQCGRPFAWRKTWERVWEEVRYCSDACRREARRAGRTGAPPDEAPLSPRPPRSPGRSP